MKIVIFAIAIIGYAQCAKLDHLKYLPPDNRPAKQETYDQGLAAPTNGQTQGSFGTGPQPQTTSFEKSASFGTPAPGAFNAGSQNAAHLQGSPFVSHGPQSNSGAFGNTASTSQPAGGFPSGQQTSNKPTTTYGGSDVTQQGPQSSPGALPQGSAGYKTSSFGSGQPAGPYGTNSVTSTFGKSNQGYHGSTGPQESGQPQSGAQGPEATFRGTIGSNTDFPQGSSFAKNSPVINNFQPQTTSGSYGAGSQPSRTFGSPTTSFSSKNVSPDQSYGAAGRQYPTQQSSGGFGTTNQGPTSSGPSSTPTGSFTGGYSAPAQSKYQPAAQNQIPIIRLDNKNYGDGTYSHAYETGNGIQAEEQGETHGDNSIAQGSFSYTSPEGEKVGVSYTADEDGYHPQGEHLPTPPPVPEAILKSIEYNMAHPEEEDDDGSYRETDSSDSDGQYKPSFSNSQFSGASKKYLAPTPGSASKSQFSGTSLTPFGSSNFKSSAPGENYFSSNAPSSSSQRSFSSPGYSSGSPADDSQVEHDSVSDGQSSPQSSNQYSSSGYQYKTPSSVSSGFSAPTANSKTVPSPLNSFRTSKTIQDASVDQPAQNYGPQKTFSSNSGFNAPSNSAPGSITPNTGSSGPFNFQSSSVAPKNQGSYGPSGAGSSSFNVPQGVSSNQFLIHGSGSGPSASGSSLSPSQPSTKGSPNNQESYGPSGAASSSFNVPQGSSSGQFSFHGSNSGPSNAFIKSGGSFSPSQPGIKDASNIQESYGPSGVGSSGSNVPQGISSSQFPSHGSSSGPSNAFIKPGSSFGPSQPGAKDASNNQGSYGPSSGDSSDSNVPQGISSSQFPSHSSSSGRSNTFGKSLNPSQPSTNQYQSSTGAQSPVSFGASGTKSSQSSGYQYNAPSTPFGGSKSQYGASSEQKPFASGPAQGPGSSSTGQFGPGSASSTTGQFGPGSASSTTGQFGPGSASSTKGAGEFGTGVTGGYSGPKTPGVQPQDQDGGYLY